MSDKSKTINLSLSRSLLPVLQNLHPLTSTNSVMPLSRFVLIEKRGEDFFVSASDVSCYRQIKTDAITSDGEDFSFCVEHAKLYTTMKLDGELDCTLQFKPGLFEKKDILEPYRLKAISSKNAYAMPVEPGDDFMITPKLDDFNGGVNISSVLLKESLDGASRFLQKDEYANAGDCIHMYALDDRLIVESSDGASIYVGKVKIEQNESTDLLVQSSISSLLISALPSDDILISIHEAGTKGLIRFSEDDWMTFTLFSGNPRSCKKMVDSIDPPTAVTVESKEVAKYVNHMINFSGVVSLKLPLVRMKVTDSGLNLSCYDEQDKYKSEVAIEGAVDGYGATQLELIANGMLTTRALNVFSGFVIISVGDKMPMKFTARDKDPDLIEEVVCAQISVG